MHCRSTGSIQLQQRSVLCHVANTEPVKSSELSASCKSAAALSIVNTIMHDERNLGKQTKGRKGLIKQHSQVKGKQTGTELQLQLAEAIAKYCAGRSAWGHHPGKGLHELCAVPVGLAIVAVHRRLLQSVYRLQELQWAQPSL